MGVYRVWWREDKEDGESARWVVALSPEQSIRRFLRDQVPHVTHDGYEAVVYAREYGGDHKTRLYGTKIVEGRTKIHEIPLPPYSEITEAVEHVVAEISEDLNA